MKNKKSENIKGRCSKFSEKIWLFRITRALNSTKDSKVENDKKIYGTYSGKETRYARIEYSGGAI